MVAKQYSMTYNTAMTTAQVAAIFGLSRRRVQQMIERGQLRATKVGKVWIVDPADLPSAQRRKPGRPKTERQQ